MGTLNILECIRADYPICAALSTRARNGRYFDTPITEDIVSAHHQMPYFLTKWVGEELCMTYYHQYGVPSTVFRFSTVIEPGEFLSDAACPSSFY